MQEHKGETVEENYSRQEKLRTAGQWAGMAQFHVELGMQSMNVWDWPNDIWQDIKSLTLSKLIAI